MKKISKFKFLSLLTVLPISGLTLGLASCSTGNSSSRETPEHLKSFTYVGQKYTLEIQPVNTGDVNNLWANVSIYFGGSQNVQEAISNSTYNVGDIKIEDYYTNENNGYKYQTRNIRFKWDNILDFKNNNSLTSISLDNFTANGYRFYDSYKHPDAYNVQANSDIFTINKSFNLNVESIYWGTTTKIFSESSENVSYNISKLTNLEASSHSMFLDKDKESQNQTQNIKGVTFPSTLKTIGILNFDKNLDGDIADYIDHSVFGFYKKMFQRDLTIPESVETIADQSLSDMFVTSKNSNKNKISIPKKFESEKNRILGDDQNSTSKLFDISWYDSTPNNSSKF
ncbi:hypothetical protein D8X55_04415 [Malacoplasma penetrans]|nr:hypothetical protein [Malacoplasma penetrans]RXY96210.1 hypothetical protein D8X55_04415 [Malacoplasma penetrans]